MFNCEKCWDRICTCGHEYRNLPHTVKIGIIMALQEQVNAHYDTMLNEGRFPTDTSITFGTVAYYGIKTYLERLALRAEANVSIQSHVKENEWSIVLTFPNNVKHTYRADNLSSVFGLAIQCLMGQGYHVNNVEG